MKKSFILLTLFFAISSFAAPGLIKLAEVTIDPSAPTVTLLQANTVAYRR